MSVDWTALSALGVATVGLAGTVYTAKAGRRTRHQERRDDFEVITAELRREVDRLSKRVDDQELDATEWRARVASQDFTIRYLVGWVRSLVGLVQTSGLELPPPPRPIPEEVRPYLRDLNVG